MNDYYIYGLVDPADLPLGKSGTLEEILGSIFYVGKGIGTRKDQHLKDAVYMLKNEPESVAAAGEKIQKIISLLESEQEVRSVKLMSGFKDEKDAYRAESFAIEAVNALRKSLGKQGLTNAVKGHGVAVEDFGNFSNRLNTEEKVLEMNEPRTSIMVKGSAEDMKSGIYEVSKLEDTKLLSRFSSDVLDRISVLKATGEGVTRRGWDIHNPWTDEEARERGRQYWPIRPEIVNSWLENPDLMPEFLFLGIPESGKTVVRYVWEIDPHGIWEMHPYGGDIRWGIPLGKRVEKHKYLNKILKDGTRSKVAQVLWNYTSGIRIDNF